MNYIGLWLRIISLIIIMCLASAISYICLKKTLYVKWVVLILFVSLFGFSIFKVSQAIINPSIETFIGEYQGFSRKATSINFFSLEYCFEIDNHKKYVDSDSISANVILDLLELKSKEVLRKNYLGPAIENGLVKMTLPDKPNSKNQRYIKI